MSCIRCKKRRKNKCRIGMLLCSLGKAVDGIGMAMCRLILNQEFPRMHIRLHLGRYTSLDAEEVKRRDVNRISYQQRKSAGGVTLIEYTTILGLRYKSTNTN